MHDWKKVDAGIFHAFHHDWITAIGQTLNSGLLPEDYYALPEQVAAGFGPDVLTLQASDQSSSSGGVATLTRPKTRFVVEKATEFYRRKKSSLVVRHVSGDHIVAVLEIVSPGNKSTKDGFRAFINKAYEFLENRVNLLLIDPFPPTKRDPEGIHAAIWGEVTDEEFHLPSDKRLTFVSYECGSSTRGYIEPIAVDDALPEMPLYLSPDSYVFVPLERTYMTAFDAMPKRWTTVLNSPSE